MQAGLAKKRLSFRDVFTSRAAFFLFVLMMVVAGFSRFDFNAELPQSKIGHGEGTDNRRFDAYCVLYTEGDVVLLGLNEIFTWRDRRESPALVHVRDRLLGLGIVDAPAPAARRRRSRLVRAVITRSFPCSG